MPKNLLTHRSLRWALIWALLPLCGYWMYGLFDLDEGFYGAVTAEMNRRGEWITPYYQGQPWFEKPILLYWLAKPTYALFGSYLGLRLPSIFAALLFCAFLYRFSQKHFGGESGFKVVVVLASSLLWSALSRMMMTDTLLVACWAAALLLFWESFDEGWKKRLLSGILIGIGLLAKGPVAVLLFVPVALYGMWLRYRNQQLRPSAELVGWAVWTIGVVALAATWYVPAYLVNGQLFIEKFLIEQNLNRFTGGDTAHTWQGPQNFIFFVPILLLGMLPWSLWIPKAWPRKSEDPLLKFIAASALIPFLFFTVSGAKLPHYILPCVPFVALLVASYIEKRHRVTSQTTWRQGWVTLAVVSALINVGMPVYYHLSGHQEVHALAKRVRGVNGQVVAYQMPRREAELGTGKPKLQETSHPSLTLYTEGSCLNVEEILLQDGHLRVQPTKDSESMPVALPLWVITRSTRADQIKDLTTQLEASGFLLKQVGPSENYLLVEITKP